jgi:L-alanine-DL-glutamate epimerase-like enolase superfamily enzyme
MLTFQIEEKSFLFNFPAGTSRGILTKKKSWFVSVSSNALPFAGLGECSIISGLSPEYINDFDYYKRIQKAIDYLSLFELNDLFHQFENEFDSREIEVFFNSNPSIRFGFETAFLDLKNQQQGIYFLNDFSHGQRKIPINGLIWMGDEKFMKKQIEEKLNRGFSTLKMKVGSIDFNTELNLIKSIRSSFSDKEITLRVDANGAFSHEDVEDKLIRLSEYSLHSIEQPLSPGNLGYMKELCQKNIIAIALDEELIGITEKDQKQRLLQYVCPQYIILKPSLHGGIKGTREWIGLAEEQSIKWWITSALESNVGLSAICQFTVEFNNSMPQGLGTGSLYSNNIDKGLRVEKGFIFHDFNRLDNPYLEK